MESCGNTTGDTGWLMLTIFVHNEREAVDFRGRWTKPKNEEESIQSQLKVLCQRTGATHKLKNLINIFKLRLPFMCIVTLLFPSLPALSLPLPFPEFFSSSDLQCTPFTGPLPSSEKRPLSSPLPHSHPTFLTVFFSLALIVNIFPAFLPSLPPSIPWPSVGGWV